MKILSLFIFIFFSACGYANSIKCVDKKSTIVLNELKFDLCLLKKNGDPDDQFVGVRLVRKNIEPYKDQEYKAIELKSGEIFQDEIFFSEIEEELIKSKADYDASFRLSAGFEYNYILPENTLHRASPRA